eukprot:TRINITY_DN91584_c0_g1_i1.p1 TRINITY_DN91584_c0_g1~~TRINITY_DN91584_c0_g1_i1.p1  ORF type:complete len:600 (+),score=104.83 TRINITY_DN91584_c0_g1_i1:29-1828(+)
MGCCGSTQTRDSQHAVVLAEPPSAPCVEEVEKHLVEDSASKSLTLRIESESTGYGEQFPRDSSRESRELSFTFEGAGDQLLSPRPVVPSSSRPGAFWRAPPAPRAAFKDSVNKVVVGRRFSTTASIEAATMTRRSFNRAEEDLVRAVFGAWQVLLEIGEMHVPAASSKADGRTPERHLICQALPSQKSIHLVELPVLRSRTPWPRCQEVLQERSEQAVAWPERSDFVFAVSHMWFYQHHPDPYGEKADICNDLVAQASKAKRAASSCGDQGRTLVFFDYLCMTQRPFMDGQAPRTAKQEKNFRIALKAMPMVYLYSDAIIALDAVPNHTSCDSKSDVYGPRATSRPSERGWIYLERFIAMIKVAMTGAGFDRDLNATSGVIFSDSPVLLTEILQRGEKLRVAALAGKQQLKNALRDHVLELEHKTFSATSVDKQTNTGGAGGSSGNLSDKQVVQAIMQDMVRELREHWDKIAKGESYDLTGLLMSKFHSQFQSFKTKNLLSGFASTPSTARASGQKSGSSHSFGNSDIRYQEFDALDCGGAPLQACSCFSLVPKYSPRHSPRDTGFETSDAPIQWVIRHEGALNTSGRNKEDLIEVLFH